MCGRYVLASPGAVIAEYFGLSEVPVYPPHYNIAPTMDALVVRETPDGEREAVMLRWGLIPAWATDPKIGSRMINARAEGVVDRPAFRAAFRRRRCLVPADGFYEWQPVAGGRKQPYFIRFASGAPLALAGLWEEWRGPAGDAIATWLSSPNPSALLGSWAGEPLEFRPVSTRVNSVQNDAPELLERV